MLLFEGATPRELVGHRTGANLIRGTLAPLEGSRLVQKARKRRITADELGETGIAGGDASCMMLGGT